MEGLFILKPAWQGGGKRLDTIYVTEEELEEKIHMDITYED